MQHTADVSSSYGNLIAVPGLIGHGDNMADGHVLALPMTKSMGFKYCRIPSIDLKPR